MVQKVIMGVLVLGVIVLALPMIAAVMKGDAGTAKPTVSAPETPTPAAAPVPQPVPVPQAQAPMPGGAPQVVAMVPANGSMGVSSRLDKLIVTFDRPMAGGFSWTGGGPQMPQGAGRPYWMPDRKTCVLPVRLAPNYSYRLGLNSPSHQNFRSAEGIPLQRVNWTFSTGQ